jgi:hypothetical protein
MARHVVARCFFDALSSTIFVHQQHPSRDAEGAAEISSIVACLASLKTGFTTEVKRARGVRIGAARRRGITHDCCVILVEFSWAYEWNQIQTLPAFSRQNCADLSAFVGNCAPVGARRILIVWEILTRRIGHVIQLANQILHLFWHSIEIP